MTPQAVLFDMDGLLLDTERVCLESFVAARRIHNLPDDEHVFLSVIGLRGPDASQVIRDSLNDALDLKVFDKTWEEQLKMRYDQEIPVKQGAAQLLEILVSKGLPLAVATSTPTKIARHKLGKIGLLPHFNSVIGGDMVMHGKPNPEIYHRAATELGFDANVCYAFEDSEPGATAAMASGATTIQVPDMIQPSPEFTMRGHIIAPTLLDGAVLAGLIDPFDLIT